jgi:C4-dicarboxylate-specific signal transduction histidine kinase
MYQIFRPTSTVIATVVLTIFLFIPVIWITGQEYQQFDHLIQHELPLNAATEKIIYLDEVLTMSAKMYANTGDATWKTRYELFGVELDLELNKFRKLAQHRFITERAKTIDAANQKLVKMEEQSFTLVEQGKKLEGQALLSSVAYETEKIKLGASIETSQFYLDKELHDNIIYYSQKIFFSIIFPITSLILLIPLWLIVLRLLKKYLRALKNAQSALIKANQELDLRVNQRTQELNDRNLHLKQTFKELQQTQTQLIHAEKMSSLGQMVAGIAHEINNPLNFISGNLK